VFEGARGEHMQRRKFSREFKIETVRLVGERGVSVAQASRNIDVNENVVRKWVKEFWRGSEASTVR
jgi:transposase